MSVDLGLNEGLNVGCRDCGPAPAGHGECGCGGGCAGGAIERPRWFAGQLVGPADLEALQRWVITKTRRHNRLVHGWGVVCGLAVTSIVSPETGAHEPWVFTVGPGSAISGCGDDISVASRIQIDIRQPKPTGSDACTPPVDPWCAPMRQRRDPERTYYLAIRHAEELRRPVHGSSFGCGCEDDPCEYSRYAETYLVALLDDLPECYQESERGGGFACTIEIEESGTRSCPDCCSPWVVLADLRVDAAGTVQIDQRSHRRFVATLAGMGFTCGTPTELRVVGFTAVEKDVVGRLFTEAQASLADIPDRASLLMAPASELRGAKGSNALRTLIGDRTVAELASMDVSILRTALAQAGGDPDTVERVHELAGLAVRMARAS
jgi:hypothetical protein